MFIELVKHAVTITGFVLIMMLLIEYINVHSRGVWQKSLKKNRFGQYLLAAVLGVIPGCLGAFTVVSLYSHRMVSFGALAAAMIATSGDEAFVMLGLFPVDAILLNAVLFGIALITGLIVDLVFTQQERFLQTESHGFGLHEEEECYSYKSSEVLGRLKQMSFPRALLVTIVLIFLIHLSIEVMEADAFGWKELIFMFGTGAVLLIVLTVPEHFLKEHLYEHVVKKHLLRIFFWTFFALAAVHYIGAYVDVEAWVRSHPGWILMSASLLGVIPESGPHLLFATMYADGLIPFAVLLASSISQDGHGTLPLLAVSRKAFLWLQLVAVVVALAAGTLFLVFV